VEIDLELVELFRGFNAHSSGEFVIKSPVSAHPQAAYSHYRSQRQLG
jgi:hypothetical protein